MTAPTTISDDRAPRRNKLLQVSSFDELYRESQAAAATAKAQLAAAAPLGIDIRLHGNDVYIGGCWGSVNVNDAVKLAHQSRVNLPPPTLMVAADDVAATLKERNERMISEFSDNRLRTELFGRYLVTYMLFTVRGVVDWLYP